LNQKFRGGKRGKGAGLPEEKGKKFISKKVSIRGANDWGGGGGPFEGVIPKWGGDFFEAGRRKIQQKNLELEVKRNFLGFRGYRKGPPTVRKTRKKNPIF